MEYVKPGISVFMLYLIILVMPQHLTVVEYDPEWLRMFECEAAVIRRILGANCVAVNHIGSTAVPGLAAKPVIDIMPVVKSLADVDLQAGEFAKHGYGYMGEFGIAGRRYLRKGGDERTHQVHVFEEGDVRNVCRHLAFRDYLRTHGDVREGYAALKRRLAAMFPYDIVAYCDGKERFVKTVEAKAMEAWKCGIVNVCDRPGLLGEAAGWFHEKWNIPEEEYASSIGECIAGGSPVPQWYVAMCGEAIVGGLGVIENDFHDRKDLSPNVCALYVEKAFRNCGIAGRLLEFACRDMAARGFGTLYLVTDHTSFYERYGWKFLCMVRDEGGNVPIRMYVHGQ